MRKSKLHIIWREPIRCPRCKKWAYYTWYDMKGRLFCPHCGYWEEMH